MVVEKKTERDAFAVAKDEFLMDVVRDPKAGEAAIKISVALIVRFVSRKEFEASGQLVAWPSQRKLATETGLFRSRIDRGVKALEATGRLTVERPEQRGATHHNRYILTPQNGRMAAANPNELIGRTTVANSNGRTGAANAGGVIGRTDAATMAARVGPNSLENPLEDASGPKARVASISVDGSAFEIEDKDTRAENGSGAVEPPLAISDDLRPDDQSAADIEPASEIEMDARPFAPPPDDLDAGFDQADRNANEDDDPIAVAAMALADLHGDALDNAEGHAIAALEGFCAGDAEDADAAAVTAAKLLLDAGPKDRALPIWRAHHAILSRLFRECSGDAAIAADGMNAFSEAVGVAARERAARRQANAQTVTATGVAHV